MVGCRAEALNSPMGHVLVVGCGSIGQRHIRNLKALGCNSLSAFDTAHDRLESITKSYGISPVTNLLEGLRAHPSAVFICTPPHTHLEIAQAAVEANTDLLIEKPIASRLTGIDKLLDAAAKNSGLVMVGYNLRFHPGLQKAKELLEKGAIGRILTLHAEFGQYLPDWRPTQNYREGYFTFKEQGGGILLESSHEIDCVRWLGGEIKSVSAVVGQVGDFQMETEDTALISMRLESGALAHVSLDCLQRAYSRSCKVVGSEGTLLWDFFTGVRLYEASSQRWTEIPIPLDPNEMYLREIEYFLDCVHREKTPPVDGMEGARVLEIALAAEESSRTGREIVL